MKPGERSPFQPDDELSASTPPSTTSRRSRRRSPARSRPTSRPRRRPRPAPAPAAQGVKPAAAGGSGSHRHPDPAARGAGAAGQLQRPGDRRQAALLLLPRRRAHRAATLRTLAIENKSPRPETFMEDVASYELSQDRKKILVRKAQDLFIFDVGAKAPADTTKNKVPLDRLVVPAGSARRMAADVHRGVAAGARLLLRPRHARRRLAGDARRSTCRSSTASPIAPS